ncbi:hypothetical protein C8J57DRAFT_1266362 [Mycena rebaudengoi]|nr:hypothetical protein C8J57DRAFT_1266362 [Mycena rebaudengoi]
MSLPRSTVFRIVSLSLACGDVFQTIPGTWRLYKKNWDRGSLSALCFCYAVARYFSIFSLIIQVVGLSTFSKNFTFETCKRVYMLPNVTSLLAGMAVQVLVYIRTYAISGHSKYVRFGLGAVLLLGFPVQIFGIVYHRAASFKNGSCKGKVFQVGEPDWNVVYYSAHMAFDLIACVTATFYLLRSSRIGGVLVYSKLARLVLRDGLLYFTVVFLTNLLVVLEFTHTFQATGAGSALPLAVVLIAIQHMILNTQELTTGHALQSTDNYGQSVSNGPPRFNTPNTQQDELELETHRDESFVTKTSAAASTNSKTSRSSRPHHRITPFSV